MNFITESLKKQGFLRIYIIKKDLVFPAFPGIKKAAKKPAFSGEERPEKTGKVLLYGGRNFSASRKQAIIV